MLTGLAAVTALFFLDAYGWVLILRKFGQRTTPLKAIRIWMISSITRYIPGGLWSYISRAELARGENINLATLALSLWIETMVTASSALAVGFPSLLYAGGIHIRLWHIIIYILLGLSIHPWILSLLRYIPGRIGSSFAAVRLPTANHIFFLYLYYSIFWVLFGAAFATFTHMLFPLTGQKWLLVGSSMAMGFFAGFIILFAPGGIGVREATLYFLLLPHMPEAQATILAVTSRLWIMSGEMLSLLIIEIIYRRSVSKKLI
jgi:hypothetical protein